LFRNRVEAGRRLAAELSGFQGPDVVVLGIPRGGVVVANEVARALGAPLDVVVTRKIGAPGQPEFALGAVTQEGDVIMDREAAESIGASPAYLEEEVRSKQDEIRERMSAFRGGAPYPSLQGKRVLIIDDGIATGSSIEAAIISVKRRNPKEVIVAVPVAPADAVERLSKGGVRVVCLEKPSMFMAIGEFYRDFAQVGDSEVRKILGGSSAAGELRPV
jgi:putative phosphoribosyl transferase